MNKISNYGISVWGNSRPIFLFTIWLLSCVLRWWSNITLLIITSKTWPRLIFGLVSNAKDVISCCLLFSRALVLWQLVSNTSWCWCLQPWGVFQSSSRFILLYLWKYIFKVRYNWWIYYEILRNYPFQIIIIKMYSEVACFYFTKKKSCMLLKNNEAFF